MAFAASNVLSVLQSIHLQIIITSRRNEGRTDLPPNGGPLSRQTDSTPALVHVYMRSWGTEDRYPPMNDQNGHQRVPLLFTFLVSPRH
jgi:hypothetical protein